MNALVKNGYQPPTLELRTSTSGSSRRKEALTLFSRVQVPSHQVDSKTPWAIYYSFGFGISCLLIADLKCSPKT